MSCPSQHSIVSHSVGAAITRGSLSLSFCACCVSCSFTFPFYFYGEPYSSCLCWHDSGNLDFGTPGAGRRLRATFLMGTLQRLDSMLPVFAPFNGAFDIATSSNSGNGSVSWSIEQLAPGQRALVVRYTDIPYTTGYTYGSNQHYNERGNAMSMDVLLYESPMGRIDVRYYRIDVDGANAFEFQVGMQSAEGLLGAGGEGNSGGSGGYYYSDDYSVLFLPFNDLDINNVSQSRLQGNTLTFNFTGLYDVNTTVCGGLGYDFRNQTGSTLTYWDKPNTADGNKYFIQLCGDVKAFPSAARHCWAATVPWCARPAPLPTVPSPATSTRWQCTTPTLSTGSIWPTACGRPYRTA